LGRLGGIIMARTNEKCGAWVADRLEIGPDDSVLEVGFGSGVIIRRLSKLTLAGHVAGIDPSQEMVELARLGIQTASRAAVSTCGAAPWRDCHSMTEHLMLTA
jgi:ubiquinone/menaquinone biosynthesis C-methylase UbiE